MCEISKFYRGRAVGEAANTGPTPMIFRFSLQSEKAKNEKAPKHPKNKENNTSGYTDGSKNIENYTSLCTDVNKDIEKPSPDTLTVTKT